MHITEHTPTVLRLQESKLSSYVGFFLFGFPLFLSGLAISLISTNPVTLNCERIEPAQVTCKLTSPGILQTSLGRRVTAIGQLQRAEIQGRTDSEGIASQEVMLITENSQIRLAKYYGLARKRQTVDQINAFINNPTAASLKIQQDIHWLAYIFGYGFMLIGGRIMCLFLLNKFPTSCLFDKSSRQVYFECQNLLFQSDVREERLAAIKRVKVREATDEDGDKTYSIELVINSGKPICLGSLTNHSEVVKTINQFLDINFWTSISNESPQNSGSAIGSYRRKFKSLN